MVAKQLPSVSRLEASKSLGSEVSHGQTSFAAGIVLELAKHKKPRVCI